MSIGIAQLILLLACIATAWAQAGLPTCARLCLEAIAPSFACPPSNFQCLCTHSDFRSKTAECFQTLCQDKNLQVQKALDEMCPNDAGPSIQSNSTSQTSGSTTLSSITSTTNSSSSSSSSPSPTPTSTESLSLVPPPHLSSTRTTVVIAVVTVLPSTTSSGIRLSPSIGFLSCFVGPWIVSVIF